MKRIETNIPNILYTIYTEFPVVLRCYLPNRIAPLSSGGGVTMGGDIRLTIWIDSGDNPSFFTCSSRTTTPFLLIPSKSVPISASVKGTSTIGSPRHAHLRGSAPARWRRPRPTLAPAERVPLRLSLISHQHPHERRRAESCTDAAHAVASGQSSGQSSLQQQGQSSCQLLR